jgi:hypothetical protein
LPGTVLLGTAVQSLGHPVNEQRVPGAARTGDEVRPWAHQRVVRCRDGSPARARGGCELLRVVAVQDGGNRDKLVARVVCVLAGIIIVDQADYHWGGSMR